MKRLLTRVGLVIAVTAMSVSFALAGPDKKSEPPKCPACKMELSAKKDKDHTKAVKIKGKTYYCCAKCPMGSKKKM